VKRAASIVLGVVTSIGGFVEAGSISTAAQAGAEYGFALLWAIAAAALLLAVLAEMSGRLSALSGRTFISAVRERFGFHYQFALLVAELLIDTLLLTAELGGAAIAIQLLTGTDYRVWLPVVALAGAAILWLGSFSVIEDGVGILGLVTLSFVVAAYKLHPGTGSVAHGLLPSLPSHEPARYAFLAVTIVGATVSPYLINFYGSGAVEEEWNERDLPANRVTAFLGMGFGAVVSMGMLVVAAVVLHPHGARVNSFGDAAQAFPPVFGRWGVPIFAVSLLVGCVGAAVEIALNTAYALAQGFGWTWGADKKRANAARFSFAFTLVLLASLAIGLCGFDPLKVTLLSVSLTVVLMPVVVLPMLVLMNDEHLVRRHRSSVVGNTILAALTVLGAVMALIVVPLEVMGGG
jgi:Mn2+/Fe2+ NRAMP family transporter